MFEVQVDFEAWANLKQNSGRAQVLKVDHRSRGTNLVDLEADSEPWVSLHKLLGYRRVSF